MEDFSKYWDYLWDWIIEYYRQEIKWKNIHSLDGNNFESYFSMVYAIICDFWDNFFSENMWRKFNKPKLIISNSTKLDKNSKRIIYYSKEKNAIIVHKDIFLKFLWKIVINDIAFINIIAHEFWHVLQGQIWIMKTEKEKEYWADFIAWYTIKKIREMYWIVTQEDINNVLIDIENSWNVTEIFCESNWVKNVHWNWKKRKSNFIRWLKSDKKKIVKYLKWDNIWERIMHILLWDFI